MIGIDISTCSTGITIKDKKGDVYHYNITDKITKYNKNSDCIETLYVEKIEKSDCYSENERNKFLKYKKIKMVEKSNKKIPFPIFPSVN